MLCRSSSTTIHIVTAQSTVKPSTKHLFRQAFLNPRPHRSKSKMYRVLSLPLVLVTLLSISLAFADPIDSFPNVTSPNTLRDMHELSKRGASYYTFNVQWPEKSLMFCAANAPANQHWWSDEPWAGNYAFSSTGTGDIPGAVEIQYYPKNPGDYMWKTESGTAVATVSLLPPQLPSPSPSSAP